MSLLRAVLDAWRLEVNKAGQPVVSTDDAYVMLGLPPGASRAVAAALGANPWPLLIPCHRIIGANGKMTGFSGPGGIATKIRLLTLEGTQLI